MSIDTKALIAATPATVALVRRELDKSRESQRGGMQCSIPKAVKVDCAMVERLCRIAEKQADRLAELEAENGRLQDAQSDVLANLDAPDDMDVISAAHFVAGSLHTAEEALEAAQAEARELRAEARGLRAELARVREIVSGMREYADSCDHPSEASKRNAVECWLTQLEDAISQPAEQHDPLAVSDHCGERESLPLMARRPRHKDDDLGELYENGKRLCTISGEPPLREPMPGFVLYRIADTDEHGLPVVPRTADMPSDALYRSRWLSDDPDAWIYWPRLQAARDPDREVWQRIEDFNEHAKGGQEGAR